MLKFPSMFRQISSISACLILINSNHGGNIVQMASAFKSPLSSSDMRVSQSTNARTRKPIGGVIQKNNAFHQRTSFVGTSYSHKEITSKSVSSSTLSMAAELAPSILDYSVQLSVLSAAIVAGTVYFQNKTATDVDTEIDVKPATITKFSSVGPKGEIIETKASMAITEVVTNVEIAIPEVLDKIKVAEEFARKTRMETRNSPTSQTQTSESAGAKIEIAIPEVLSEIQAAENHAREARMAAKNKSEMATIAPDTNASNKPETSENKSARSSRAIAVEEERKADMEAVRKQAERSKVPKAIDSKEKESAVVEDKTVEEVDVADKSKGSKRGILKKRYVVASALLVVGKRLIGLYAGRGLL
mmetsp:Transcript_49713/g.59823  ORF Transcript_49713/g.59823 Transcript_49713/m.59823 type:complete len:360 (-) Transcript_49713:67-1146(-)